MQFEALCEGRDWWHAIGNRTNSRAVERNCSPVALHEEKQTSIVLWKSKMCTSIATKQAGVVCRIAMPFGTHRIKVCHVPTTAITPPKQNQAINNSGNHTYQSMHVMHGGNKKGNKHAINALPPSTIGVLIGRIVTLHTYTRHHTSLEPRSNHEY